MPAFTWVVLAFIFLIYALRQHLPIHSLQKVTINTKAMLFDKQHRFSKKKSENTAIAKNDLLRT